jgi:hypothetical protein
MTEQVNTAAKEEKRKFWRNCPICFQDSAAPPEFSGFLPFLEHMEEHFQPEPRPVQKRRASPYVTEAELIAFHFGAELLERPKTKKADQARLLFAVSIWLQEALAACPEVNRIQTSDINVGGPLGRSGQETAG